ncbi:hypothetical protein LEP1GSC088_4498 [Leptospira interrogans str. L1207]|nr:hypothetical protein LEP1GSC088_4498 [Leptospira interrogans str. L1207]
MKLFLKRIRLLLWMLFLFFLSINKTWSHDIRLPDYFKEEETSSYPFYLNFKLNQDFSAGIRLPDCLQRQLVNIRSYWVQTQTFLPILYLYLKFR